MLEKSVVFQSSWLLTFCELCGWFSTLVSKTWCQNAMQKSSSVQRCGRPVMAVVQEHLPCAQWGGVPGTQSCIAPCSASAAALLLSRAHQARGKAALMCLCPFPGLEWSDFSLKLMVSSVLSHAFFYWYLPLSPVGFNTSWRGCLWVISVGTMLILKVYNVWATGINYCILYQFFF